MWESFVIVVCCQVEVCASGWSLIQRSPTDCSVSEYDREPRQWRDPDPLGAVAPREKNKFKMDKVANLTQISYTNRRKISSFKWETTNFSKTNLKYGVSYSERKIDILNHFIFCWDPWVAVKGCSKERALNIAGLMSMTVVMRSNIVMWLFKASNNYVFVETK